MQTDNTAKPLPDHEQPLLYGRAHRQEQTQDRWSRRNFAGRLSELSSCGPTASLTLAFSLIAEAQLEGEPVAWITTHRSSFFPPDASAGGIDLNALAVIAAPDSHSAARVADHLTRSGGFGLVVLDLGADITVPMPLQTRLLGLAKKHDTAIVCITEKSNDTPSLGSLISLRAETLRTKTSEGRFTCKADAIKDKKQGPGWSHVEVHSGPPGLR